MVTSLSIRLNEVIVVKCQVVSSTSVNTFYFTTILLRQSLIHIFSLPHALFLPTTILRHIFSLSLSTLPFPLCTFITVPLPRLNRTQSGIVLCGPPDSALLVSALRYCHRLKRSLLPSMSIYSTGTVRIK